MENLAGWGGLLTGGAALIVAIVGFIKLFRGNVSDKADAMQKFQEMLNKEIERSKKMREEIDQLRIEKADLEQRLMKVEICNEKYRKGVDRLIKQMEAHEIKPAWRP
jgi:Tfp pilus assembly protein PilN